MFDVKEEAEVAVAGIHLTSFKKFDPSLSSSVLNDIGTRLIPSLWSNCKYCLEVFFFLQKFQFLENIYLLILCDSWYVYRWWCHPHHGAEQRATAGQHQCSPSRWPGPWKSSWTDQSPSESTWLTTPIIQDLLKKSWLEDAGHLAISPQCNIQHQPDWYLCLLYLSSTRIILQLPSLFIAEANGKTWALGNMPEMASSTWMLTVDLSLREEPVMVYIFKKCPHVQIQMIKMSVNVLLTIFL